MRDDRGGPHAGKFCNKISNRYSENIPHRLLYTELPQKPLSSYGTGRERASTGARSFPIKHVSGSPSSTCVFTSCSAVIIVGPTTVAYRSFRRGV